MVTGFGAEMGIGAVARAEVIAEATEAAGGRVNRGEGEDGCRPGCGPGSPMAAEDNPGRGATGGTESLPYDQGHVAGVIS